MSRAEIAVNDTTTRKHRSSVEPMEYVGGPTPSEQSSLRAADANRPRSRARKRVPGYRIQVYTGNNTRVSKQKALDRKVQIQKLFPELSVYVHFQSPRWICHAGDFISREEARPYLTKMRKFRIAPEASIVACPVLRAY